MLFFLGELYLGPVLICPSRSLRYRAEFYNDPRWQNEFNDYPLLCVNELLLYMPPLIKSTWPAFNVISVLHEWDLQARLRLTSYKFVPHLLSRHPAALESLSLYGLTKSYGRLLLSQGSS